MASLSCFGRRAGAGMAGTTQHPQHRWPVGRPSARRYQLCPAATRDMHRVGPFALRLRGGRTASDDDGSSQRKKKVRATNTVHHDTPSKPRAGRNQEVPRDPFDVSISTRTKRAGSDPRQEDAKGEEVGVGGKGSVQPPATPHGVSGKSIGGGVHGGAGGGGGLMLDAVERELAKSREGTGMAPALWKESTFSGLFSLSPQVLLVYLCACV